MNPTGVSQPFLLRAGRVAGGNWSCALLFPHAEGWNGLVSITSLLLGFVGSERSPLGWALVKLPLKKEGLVKGTRMPSCMRRVTLPSSIRSIDRYSSRVHCANLVKLLEVNSPEVYLPDFP